MLFLKFAQFWFNTIYKFMSNKKLLIILPYQKFHLPQWCNSKAAKKIEWHGKDSTKNEKITAFGKIKFEVRLEKRKSGKYYQIFNWMRAIILILFLVLVLLGLSNVWNHHPATASSFHRKSKVRGEKSAFIWPKVQKNVSLWPNIDKYDWTKNRARTSTRGCWEG